MNTCFFCALEPTIIVTLILHCPPHNRICSSNQLDVLQLILLKNIDINKVHIL